MDKCIIYMYFSAMDIHTITDSPVYYRLVAGHTNNNADYRVRRPNGTNDYLFMITRSGTGVFRNSQSKSYLTKGNVAIIPPQTPHDYGTEKSVGHWQIIWIHCHPWQHLQELLKRPVEPSGAIVINMEDTAIWSAVDCAFEQAYQESISNNAQRILWSMNALERALLYCDKAAPLYASPNSDKRIEKSIDFMLEHIAEPITVADIAAAVGLSPSRFAHLFVELMAISPQRFLEKQRLDRARDLLACTTQPITQIAMELGFSDQFYFSRRFSKANGTCPRAFRKAVQAGE